MYVPVKDGRKRLPHKCDSRQLESAWDTCMA